MDENDKHCCKQMLQANRLIQMGQQEKAYDIIQALLDSQAISFEYDPQGDSENQSQPFAGSTAASTQAMQNSYQGTYNHT